MKSQTTHLSLWKLKNKISFFRLFYLGFLGVGKNYEIPTSSMTHESHNVSYVLEKKTAFSSELSHLVYDLLCLFNIYIVIIFF